MNSARSRRTVLDKAAPGDILLFRHASGWSRLIPFISGSRYHHVGLYAGAGWVVESRVTGVIRRDLNAAKVRLRVRVLPAPSGQEVGWRALEWAQTQIGRPYAYGSIVALVIDRLLEPLFGSVDVIWRQKDRVSCAELVVQAYEAAGVTLFSGAEPEQVAPWDFELLLRRQS